LNALVRIALARPYTFIVMAVLIMIFGIMAALRTPTDIFPEIRVPVIGVAFNYAGLSPGDMSNRIVTQFERFLTTTVNDVEHVESQSLPGIGIVKVYFQPGVDIRTATAQVTAVAQVSVKQMPAGITPPLVLNYSAATVPILQLADSDKTLSEQKLFDLSQVVIRPVITTVPGAATPYPYGGQIRQIQIDLDPQLLQSKGISANDVTNALAAQNQILPVGFVKIGSYQYNVRLNDSADTIEDLNDLPIKTVGGATLYIRDVGQVRDGSGPQTNIVHVDGGRAVLSTILKNGSASTLAVVQGVKDKLPGLAEQLPSTFKITALNDQSLFVKGAISSVVREGAIAAALTSLMILLFLGSWRSTVIIAVSIPLAVLAAIAALSVSGQTLNIMTLGGLALAVGILVDDATVTIENINWHLEQGKDVRTAILDGAQQIVTPAFVSLLCICIVFVPMFLLKGVAGFLFVPMAMSVVYAMIASFILSRTLVPTMAMYLLKAHHGGHAEYLMESHGGAAAKGSRNPLVRFQHAFEARFARVREGYRGVLALALTHRPRFLVGFMVVVAASFLLMPMLGSNFFPSIDSGAMILHVRAPVGTRLEDTAAEFDRVEQAIRGIVPPNELSTVVDNIGLPVSGINRAYSNTGGIGPQDGDIYITLAEHHRPTAQFMAEMRRTLPQRFPGSVFSFLPADIISQILNFGAPAPIDVQVAGPDRAQNEAYAGELLQKLRAIPGLADVRLQQSTHYPQLNVAVDRSEADRLGVTERDVTNTMVTSLAGSFQTSPAFWLNPRNGVSYPIVIQSPQQDVNSFSKLENMPLGSNRAGDRQILGGVATLGRGEADAVVSHYAIQPSFDIYATTQGSDLGGVAKAIRGVLKDTARDAPKGATVSLRGQVSTMDSAFTGLGLGLLGAIVLIYLLIVVNFQSWADPFVIVSALPAALAGIVWMLFITGTPLSVPALTGAIMCMGVATANSILVVSFARERLAATGDGLVAALEAGFTRFRPVLMTALAMIIGMAPMALGLGEGGEQNAPLGRAVIGGLIFATCASLLFVPVVFSLVHRKAPAPAQSPAPDRGADPGEAYAV
jgi:multidrug efflux pump subunit AcrB